MEQEKKLFPKLFFAVKKLLAEKLNENVVQFQKEKENPLVFFQDNNRFWLKWNRKKYLFNLQILLRNQINYSELYVTRETKNKFYAKLKGYGLMKNHLTSIFHYEIRVHLDLNKMWSSKINQKSCRSDFWSIHMTTKTRTQIFH